MKLELQNKIFEACPFLYGDRNKSATETCMCWGLSVGDGWYSLIYDLSIKLESLIKKFVAEYPQAHEEDVYPKASQVKEKFGGLRFYMTSYTDEIRELIDEAERKSFTICEQCGEAGKRRSGSWLTTKCDSCHEG